MSLFNTGLATLNIGGYSASINAIAIPNAGIYEISYTIRTYSQNNGSGRKVNPSYIRVNNADPDGQMQALGSCYLIFNNTPPRHNCQGASTILDLNQNDLISVWSYREGGEGDSKITGGHLTIKRIA